MRLTRRRIGATALSSIACAGAALLLQGLAPGSAKSLPTPRAAAAPVQMTVPAAAEAETIDDGASAELFVSLQPGDTLQELLIRAGVTRADAAEAGALITRALGSPAAPGSEVGIALGKGDRSARHRLQRLALRSGLELKLAVVREGAGLRLVREDIEVDSTPLRFRGRAGAGLYWSMRARGVPPQIAADYLSVVSARIDLPRQLGPSDEFDLILAHRRAATGESQTGPLLYAGIDRRSGPDLQLVNWSAGGRSGWFSPNDGAGNPAALRWPVSGRVTSAFGTRVHPILRFARFHAGVDVGAAWGSPVVAAADGHVVGAGWNGGHGRQVRIAHGSGLETSYSHLSQIAASAGSSVRRGQLIGYVGSTGFSTGPHLHYEVRDRGRLVDPLAAADARSGGLTGRELDAVRARLRQLLSIQPARSALA